MFRRNKYLGIITGNVITAEEDATAFEIAKLMKENDIGVVVIVNSGKVVGIASERDIARRIVADGKRADKVKAGDFMTKEVIAVQIKDGLNNIYKTLCEMKFRHLIVMDNDKLVGITSRRDLLDVLTSKKPTRKV